MARPSYKGRIASIYFRSSEELRQFAGEAKAAGCPLSTYILEMVAKAREAAHSRPHEIISKDLEDMKQELRIVRKENREKELLLEHYETELFKLRNQTFSQVDAHHTGKEYETRLVSMLQEGKTLSSYKILQELGVDPNDSDAVRLISNQLEELRKFGLVKETAAGWRWMVKR
jgi:hypothetical protein